MNSVSTRKPVRTALVGKRGAGILAAGLPFTDPATRQINLNEGQIGFFDRNNVSFDPTAANFPTQFYVAQGTAFSKLVGTRDAQGKLADVVRKSNIINTKNITETSYEGFQQACLNATLFSGFVPTSNTEYSITLSWRGVRIGMEYAHSGPKTYTPSVFVKDVSALTAAQKQSQLIKQFAREINRNSKLFTSSRTTKHEIVALPINLAGGTATGVDLADFPATPFTVGNGLIVTSSALLDAPYGNDIAATVEKFIGVAGITGATEVVNADGTDLATGLILVALNSESAIEDRVKWFKTTLEVKLNTGFSIDDNAATLVKLTSAYEGSGTYHQTEHTARFHSSVYINHEYQGFKAQRILEPTYTVFGERYDHSRMIIANFKQIGAFQNFDQDILGLDLFLPFGDASFDLARTFITNLASSYNAVAENDVNLGAIDTDTQG